MDFEKNSSVHDRLLKSRRLHARIRVIFNATPASKLHRQEMPEVIKLKTEGKDDITASDAAASTDLGAQVDANGNVGVCLLASQLGTLERVISVDVAARDGGTWTAALVNTGTTAYGLSASGNIVIAADSSQSLAATSADMILSIDYLRRAS